MPPRLPRISGEETIIVLQRLGFVVSRQRGSHVILKKRISKEEEIGCVVPLHHELAVGTLRSILRQSRVYGEFIIASYWKFGTVKHRRGEALLLGVNI